MENNRLIPNIENGIVIDHLPLGTVWEVARLLELEKHEGRVSLGDGYDSRRMGKKGVLKVEKKVLSDYELNLIALVAEHATINKIRDYLIAEKREAVIPNILESLVLCSNNNCISNIPGIDGVPPQIEYNSETKLFTCCKCRSQYDKPRARLVA